MASTTVQFALVPDFSQQTFRDSATVKDALFYVCQARNRRESDAEMKKLVQKIRNQTGCNSVGQLRQLTDLEWANLEVPAMCRIFMKHLVRQSQRRSNDEPKSFIEQLQDDFNDGRPFDMSQYQENIELLKPMGFKEDEAMEALVITGNKGIDAALELLFQDDKNMRKKKRAEAKKAREEAKMQGDPSMKGQEALMAMKRELDRENRSRVKTEQQLQKARAQLRVAVYRGFLEGLLTDESLNITEFEQLKVYRNEKNITEAEHRQALAELNITLEQFEAFKKFDQRGSAECVVCLDKPKSHVVMSCMHLCLCEDCQEDFKPGSKCPMCSKKIKQVVRVYQ